MEIYFASKIKVTYTFPQDFSFLWVKKKKPSNIIQVKVNLLRG